MTKKVLCLCNPLLDISADVSTAFLEKFKLKPNNAILADETLHGAEFFRELAEHKDVQYIAGGSGMNTARVCSWIMQSPNSVAYLGAVGSDKYVETLRSSATSGGVDVEGILQVSDGTPTGLCAVCIVGKERSLVAALGAANKFDAAHLQTTAVKRRIEDASIVYVTGFHLTVSVDAVMQLATHCAENKKIFAMNMSALFIMSVFKEPLSKLLPYCDIIFCNDDEAKALAQMLGYDLGDAHMTPEEIAQHIVKEGILKKEGMNTVVFTQGKDATVVCSKEHGMQLVRVPPVESAKIVDTNGAGDSFVGGFLASLSKGESLTRCAEVGNYAAGVIIQHSGCQYPATPTLP